MVYFKNRFSPTLQKKFKKFVGTIVTYFEKDLPDVTVNVWIADDFPDNAVHGCFSYGAQNVPTIGLYCAFDKNNELDALVRLQLSFLHEYAHCLDKREFISEYQAEYYAYKFVLDCLLNENIVIDLHEEMKRYQVKITSQLLKDKFNKILFPKHISALRNLTKTKTYKKLRRSCYGN